MTAPVLANCLAVTEDDPDTLAILLHGSRASGRHRDDSDCDLIRIITEQVYAARQHRVQHSS